MLPVYWKRLSRQPWEAHRSCKELSAMGSVAIKLIIQNRPLLRAGGGVITITVGERDSQTPRYGSTPRTEGEWKFPQPQEGAVDCPGATRAPYHLGNHTAGTPSRGEVGIDRREPGDQE